MEQVFSDDLPPFEPKTTRSPVQPIHLPQFKKVFLEYPTIDKMTCLELCDLIDEHQRFRNFIIESGLQDAFKQWRDLPF